jgi:serine protease Do
MGIGFAIPINLAIQIKDQLIKNGKISRSVLGINIQDVNEELAKSFGLEEKGGILISQIIEDSAAEEAGLREGDIIVELNGTKVGKMAAFRNRIASTPSNSKIELKIFRNGKYKNISAITKAMEGSAVIQAPAVLDEIGISVKDLDRTTARQFGYTEKSGVLVTEVEQDSPAARAGLQPGHLIISVNRKPVKNSDEFMEVLSAAEGRRILFLVSDGRSSRFIVVNRE